MRPLLLTLAAVFLLGFAHDEDLHLEDEERHLEEVESRFAASGRQEPDFLDDDVARDAHWYGNQKFVAVGRALETTYNRPVILRSWIDGDTDTTFGPQGYAITTVGLGWGWFHAVDLDSNDKALAVGRVWRGTGNSYNFLAQRFLTNGALDTGFDADGTLYLDPSGGGADFARDVIIQSDDKAYIIGYGGTGTPPNYDIQVYRILTNGAPDTTWGTGGLVSTSILPANDLAHDAVLTTDGKLVVAGSTNAGANEQGAVLRYLSDGTLDVQFGPGGTGYVNFDMNSPAGNQDRIFAVTEEPSTGKLVVAGRAMGASNWDTVVARINTEGSLDTSYGTDGARLRRWVGSPDWATGVHVIDVDNKVQLTGREQTTRGHTSRFLSDGADDTTYSGDGRTSHNWGNPTTFEGLLVHDAYVIAVGRVTSGETDFTLYRFTSSSADGGSGDRNQFYGTAGRITFDVFGDTEQNWGGFYLTTGHVIVHGFVENGNSATRDVAIARLFTNGSLDTTFGTNGYNMIDMNGGGVQDLSRALIIDNDGKYIMAAYTSSNALGDFTLFRFMTDGSLDSQFGAAGVASVDFNGRLDAIEHLHLDTSGKYVAAGWVRPAGTNIENWGIARFNTDGTLDATFATAGQLEIDFTGDDDFAYALEIDGANRMYVGGYTQIAPNDGSGTEGAFALMRFLSTGAVDSTFATGGNLIFEVNPGDDERIEALLLDTTGKLMVVGYMNDGANANQRMFVGRLLTDGSFDTSFGTGGQTVEINWNLGRSLGRCIFQFQHDGHYLVGGNQLRHYRTDGALYTVFNDDGDANEPSTVRECHEGPFGSLWFYGVQSNNMTAAVVYP